MLTEHETYLLDSSPVLKELQQRYGSYFFEAWIRTKTAFNRSKLEIINDAIHMLEIKDWQEQSKDERPS